ncbi:MAG TPA: amidohydrolase family protein [Ktedonobacteraceae bacterium]|nr:amidohydrolase family protein [Ktedonobacteraceae bacterium]HZU69575.1 amidohydrolase family protein [Ktedonobacteraceae bacterium]
MKIIALEERFELATIKKVVAKFLPGAQDTAQLASYSPPTAQLEELGAGRLKAMDAMGVDVQVLSYPSSGIPMVPAAEAVPLAREANDQLAAAIVAHPDRFVGMATLPMPDPEAAELERCVNTLGFRGAMIAGQTNGRFLDDSSFRPMLETAAALDVPVYLHPAIPVRAVWDVYYAGFDPAVSGSFATFGWGWHLDTRIHAQRMILGGVFDRYPSLQLILGHWEEMIPFFLARFDEILTPVAKQLQRPVADYFVQQMYATPSGMFTLPPFLLTLQIMGADRIMYSVDYPYIAGNQARAFLENASVSPADREKIAHGNAEKVLKLAPM